MAAKNPQRIELGQLVKEQREHAILTTAQVDDAMHWYPGKARRVELGTRALEWAEVDKLADLFGTKPEDRRTLHRLGDASRKREAAAHVADFAQTYVTLERSAIEIRYHDDELIYGGFQVDGYARAVLATSGAVDIDARMADRVARRDVITREDAPHVFVVLGEAALHRLVGGVEVMREQLAHLVELAKRPNVSIRILPFSVGAHRGLGIGFHYLKLASPELKRVYVEGLTDATYIHEEAEVQVYEIGFDMVWAAALDERDSGSILRRRIEQLG